MIRNFHGLLRFVCQHVFFLGIGGFFNDATPLPRGRGGGNSNIFGEVSPRFIWGRIYPF